MTEPAVSTPGDASPRPCATWRAVAIPDEHGGWGLTAEPALLGVLVAPSWAGAALAVAAFVAFIVRTPLKVVLVDRWRGRTLPRTRLAACIRGGRAGAPPRPRARRTPPSGLGLAGADRARGPLVGVELWFDMRSRSRRLIPELCGAVGIAAGRGEHLPRRRCRGAARSRVVARARGACPRRDPVRCASRFSGSATGSARC